MDAGAVVQQRLRQLQTQEDELQSSEADLLSQLEKLRTRKRGVHAEISRLTNENASIAQLPDEVLVEIFGNFREEGWRDGLPFLVRASHVIKRWRALALATPSLWTTIQLRPTTLLRQYPVDLIAHYLQLSGPKLLDIYVFICEDQDITPVAELLIPQIGRWQKLTIESADEQALQTFIAGLYNECAPHLEHLQIDLEIDDEQDETLWSGDNQTLMGGAPLLSYLGTRGVNMQLWLPPLGAVKSLYFADCYSAILLSYARLKDILMASTSLTHLEVEGMVNCCAEDELALIELPHLVSLTVLPPDYVNPVHFMRNIFSAISTPALETLCLRKVYGQQFRVFLETFRSANWHPVLHTLRLESVTGLEHLTPIFALSSPTITHISLKFITDPEPILMLLRSNTVDPLWPRLKTLTVGPGNNALLRSLISDRIAVGTPLTRLRYATESRATFDTLPDGEMAWFRERLDVENVAYHDM
ncbi:hypothetical protein FIBSPDRAFT_938832 [Athelia psychrophila]|uniref:F-box domain-containing protein n=1 Tax=Athelia psychrophila TaxID=1759441 RepID=A0A165XND1_9AGAM|nr:hypothetical protein FIBSPDRAFT_938832 [Fibularhizoctonia sp. CBS 109695]